MWLFWTYLGILGGICLVVLGWRGRRVDRHRLCRRCRYDLYGSIGSARCPECGDNLCVPGTRRLRGNRRPQPRMILSGVYLFATCLAFGSAGTYVQATGWNYIQHVPLSMVLQLAESDATSLRFRAIDELARRVKSDPACRDQVFEFALQVQGNRDIPWDRRWGDIVERAFDDGCISTKQWDRYVQQALPLEVRVSSWLQRNEPIRITSMCREIRGSRRLFHCTMNVFLVSPSRTFRVRADGWLDSTYQCWLNEESMVFPSADVMDLPPGRQQLAIQAEGFIVAKGTTIPVRLAQNVSVTIQPSQ